MNLLVEQWFDPASDLRKLYNTVFKDPIASLRVDAYFWAAEFDRKRLSQKPLMYDSPVSVCAL